MNRKAILDNAAADTASIWSLILGRTVEPWQVPLMIAGLKIAQSKASKVVDAPIPALVYYNFEKNAFTKISGMVLGEEFHREWYNRREEFPQRE